MRSIKPYIIPFILAFVCFSPLAFSQSNLIDEILPRKSGCCSYHKGVSNKCTATGRVICNDRSISPSCRCQPPRAKPKPSSPSSGNKSNRNYSGTYSGELSLTTNSCEFITNKTINTKAIVKDSGRSINVTLPSGKNYTAMPQARQGFEFYVNNDLGTYDGVSCVQKDWFWWFDVSKTGAKFQYNIKIICDNGASCSNFWYGDLTRK